jgi:hypothetical protein
MERFFSTVILDFYVALGIVLGGSILGGMGALFTHHPPMSTMLRLAGQLKIWALVSALDGTFDTLRAIETGVIGGQLSPVAKQFSYLTAAFLGSQVGYMLIKHLAGERA